MHRTFTSAAANTRLHGELVLHFATLLGQHRLCELYVRMDSIWIPDEVALYSVIQKDGLNFVRLYFLNYTWYVNDLHNI